MSAPAVSIVTPVYNCERYIRDSIESALAQDFAAFELIVVDNGSTDRTPERIAAFGDARMRTTRLSEPGLARALNAAMAYARAPLVAILDADDIALPDRLAISTAFMAEHRDVVLAGSAYRIFIDEAGQRTGREHVLPLEGPDILRGLKIVDPSPLFHSSVIFRKAEIVAAGGYSENVSAYYDVDLFIRLARSQWLANIAAPLSLKRLHPDQYFRNRRDFPETAASLAALRAAAASL